MLPVIRYQLFGASQTRAYYDWFDISRHTRLSFLALSFNYLQIFVSYFIFYFPHNALAFVCVRCCPFVFLPRIVGWKIEVTQTKQINWNLQNIQGCLDNLVILMADALSFYEDILLKRKSEKRNVFLFFFFFWQDRKKKSER